MPRRRGKQLELNDTPHARERLKETIVSRFSVRVHLFLILIGCFAAALSVTTLLHMLGVAPMYLRYPLALVAAYVAFVLGVRIWLQYAGFGGALNRDASIGDDLLDVDVGSPGSCGHFTSSSGGGGGMSGGGGASVSYDEGGASTSLPIGGTSSKSSSIGGFDIEDGAIVGVALAVVVAVVFGAAIYLIVAAPAILCDAAFAALLSGGLIRSTRRIAEHGWITSVVRHTWLSFVAILAVTMAFAAVAHHFFPEAHTVTELVRLL